MGKEISLLHPKLREKCDLLVSECRKQGINIIITQTLRTKAEQDAIYAQGRTAPGKIVTQVKFPNSMHCWGVAFDIAVKIGNKVTLDASHYKKVGPIGQKLGLEWGGGWKEFKDYPHFQLPGMSVATLKLKYGTPEKFIASWQKEGEEEMKEVPAMLEGIKTTGAINDDGTGLVPIKKLIEVFDLPLVTNYLNGKIYVRMKRDDE
jgi:peptidoglycan L-alanyl-D-glutamate endopeptidase CwlK